MSNKTKKSSNTVKTVKTVKKQNSCEYAVVNIISLLVFLAFGYIAVMSFVQTSSFDPAQYVGEVVLYEVDNIALNILFTVLFGVFVFRMKRHYDFFAKVDMRFMEIGLAAFVLIIGLSWVLSVTSIPAADSYNIFETATGVSDGNYNALTNNSDFYNSAYYNGYSYFNYYPFQLGFVFICEIIYRIFGVSSSMPVQILNVICVALAYLGIAKITKLIFKRRAIEFISIILLAGCFQPVLFCTFAYGNIIGMCCAVWASYFLIKYFQNTKYLLLLPCAVLLVLSTLAKYNNMIYLVAFVIMLVVHTVKAKKWQSIAFALALCIATVGVSNLVIISYEKRANVQFANGVSQIMYLDMGLNESSMAPGWYNGIALSAYKNNNLNDEIAKDQALNDVKRRLDVFSSDAEYTLDFFGKKILSQWNEPTFESIWVSEVKQHTEPINKVVTSVYDGSLGQFLELYFNLYMQIIYLLFAIGIYCLFLRKMTNIETILLPLVILGGFGYHMLFEGKSQYILTYIILLIPVASFALNTLLEGKYTKIKEIFGKLNTIPEEVQ